MTGTSLDQFLDWFQGCGGYIDASSVSIVDFPAAEGGRGVVAVRDIPVRNVALRATFHKEGHVLFTIPRTLTLSTRTSSLPSRFGLKEWKEFRLHKGWTGLILTMMWEGARGSESPWADYLGILPTCFNTPMFWDEKDLAELLGTSVVDKLGKRDAEADYINRVLPAIRARRELFKPEDIPEHYSLERYHIMGSNLLSRSFTVEKWDEEEDQENRLVDDSKGSDGAVDAPLSEAMEIQGPPEADGVDSDDEDEDSSDIAMVPMADMLNARYKTENAKLFHEQDELKMVSTKAIKSGEQIWNTYGDLPNAELLRRYGHLDLLSFPDGFEGNPGDVVEVKADCVVSVIRERLSKSDLESAQERIDWWLEEGGDDVFVIDYDFEVPPAMISFIRLLSKMTEWEKARKKGTPPKPVWDPEVFAIANEILERRLRNYPSTLEDDVKALRETMTTPNQRKALVVRMGEKRILHITLSTLKSILEKADTQMTSISSWKRKNGDDNGSTDPKKKSRR